MSGGVATPEKKVSFYEKQKIAFLIFTIIFSFFVSNFLLTKAFRTFALPDRGKVVLAGKSFTIRKAYYEVIPALRQKYNELYYKKKISFKEKEQVVKKLNFLQKRIEELYPTPTFFNVFKKNLYPYAKVKAKLFLFFEIVLACAGITAFFLYDRKKLYPFFFQVAKEEQPIPVGSPIDFLSWEFLGVDRNFVYSLFNSEEDYWKLMAVWDTRIIADEKYYQPASYEKDPKKVIIDFVKINKDIKEIITKLEQYGKLNGLVKEGEEQHFKAVMALTLFHFITGYFGNMPTGFMSVFIKDFTLKRVLSTYALAKIPNVKFFTTVKEKEVQPARFLRALHSYRIVFQDVLQQLKDEHSQIPDIFPLKELR